MPEAGSAKRVETTLPPAQATVTPAARSMPMIKPVESVQSKNAMAVNSTSKAGATPRSMPLISTSSDPVGEAAPSKNKFEFETVSQSDLKQTMNLTVRPKIQVRTLVALALLKAPRKMANVNMVFKYFLQVFPYFKVYKTGLANYAFFCLLFKIESLICVKDNAKIPLQFQCLYQQVTKFDFNTNT